MSNDGGARDLTETVGAPTSVADIWSGIILFDTDCGAGAESCGSRKGLLARARHLLEIFCRGPCRFGIFRSLSTSVEDVDALIGVPGEYIPCGYVGSR